jgi:hypothetical protein
MGSIQDPQRYLSAILVQGPGYVESFGQMGLQTRLYQATFHSEGALQSNHHHSHTVQVSADHWPLPGWKAGPRLGSIAMPLPLQHAAFGALGPQMHHMRAGYPVLR